MDLITLMTNGTQSALAQIAADKRITIDRAGLDRIMAALPEAIVSEHQDIVAMGDGLLNLGAGWQAQAINIGCNAAARKALKAAGYL